MNRQQIEALHALESDLQTALRDAQSSHDETLAQMDAARRTLDALLRNEEAATSLYVDDTQLQMRALRDVVRLEMDKARREVDGFLQEATERATQARDARDRTRSETREKTRALQARRQQQLHEWREQVERVARETQDEIARLGTVETLPHTIPTGNHKELTSTPQGYQLSRVQSTVKAIQTEPTWVLPLAVSLVLGVCLWIAFSGFRARRASAERRQRVLYSEQLKSHFATADCVGDGGCGEDSSQPKEPKKTRKNTESNSPRSPSSFDRRPTLHRRLRPAWSPAASTASTVSSPETPTSIFSSHSAFESVTPSPF